MARLPEPRHRRIEGEVAEDLQHPGEAHRTQGRELDAIERRGAARDDRAHLVRTVADRSAPDGERHRSERSHQLHRGHVEVPAARVQSRPGREVVSEEHGGGGLAHRGVSGRGEGDEPGRGGERRRLPHVAQLRAQADGRAGDAHARLCPAGSGELDREPRRPRLCERCP